MKTLKIEYVSPSKLKLNSKNPRLNDKAVDSIVKSIEKFGWTNPILVRKSNDVVIAGHTRLKAAIELKLKEVPVIYLDYNETNAQAYMIADNKTSEIAEWDESGLKELLLGLKDEIDLTLLGFEKDELSSFFNDDIPLKKAYLKPFHKTHILLSFPPHLLSEIKSLIEQILTIEGVEYEQSSN